MFNDLDSRNIESFTKKKKLQKLIHFHEIYIKIQEI